MDANKKQSDVHSGSDAKQARPKLYYDMSVAAYQGCLDEARADATFLHNITQAARDLETKGYAVIPNVVEHELCDWAFDEFWRATEQASGQRLKRPYKASDLKDFRYSQWYHHKNGILDHGELAHLPMTHAIRTHPRVAIVFGALYGVDRGLVVAPDRMNYQHPSEWVNCHQVETPASIANVKEAARLHVDQSFTDKIGRYCIQGLVTMLDADQDGDASLEVVEGSISCIPTCASG